MFVTLQQLVLDSQRAMEISDEQPKVATAIRNDIIAKLHEREMNLKDPDEQASWAALIVDPTLMVACLRHLGTLPGAELVVQKAFGLPPSGKISDADHARAASLVRGTALLVEALRWTSHVRGGQAPRGRVAAALLLKRHFLSKDVVLAELCGEILAVIAMGTPHDEAVKERLAMFAQLGEGKIILSAPEKNSLELSAVSFIEKLSTLRKSEAEPLSPEVFAIITRALQRNVNATNYGHEAQLAALELVANTVDSAWPNDYDVKQALLEIWDRGIKHLYNHAETKLFLRAAEKHGIQLTIKLAS